MVHADRRNHLAIITSEPLTDDATDWVPVPANHVVVVTDNVHILIAPIAHDTRLTLSLAALTGTWPRGGNNV
jgi:hypothetical protein